LPKLETAGRKASKRRGSYRTLAFRQPRDTSQLSMHAGQDSVKWDRPRILLHTLSLTTFGTQPQPLWGWRHSMSFRNPFGILS
jgi:hypothetical protein